MLKKTLICTFFVSIVFYAGCTNTQSDESDSYINGVDSPPVYEIFIEDLSGLPTETLPKEFIYKYSVERNHLQVSLSDGVIFYDRIPISDNLHSDEFELIAYNTRTGESKIIYHHSEAFYRNLSVCEDNAFWLVFGEDYWKIMRYNMTDNELSVLRQSNPYIDDALPVLFGGFKRYFFWNEYPLEEIGNCFAYDVKNGEIFELELPERYAESPFVPNACVGDSVFYIKKQFETGRFSIVEVNIKSNEILFEVEIPTKAVAVYCNGEEIMWKTSFEANEIKQLFVYSIIENKYYTLNAKHEQFAFECMGGNWIAWRNENNEDRYDVFFFNTKTWDKYVYTAEYNEIKYPRSSASGDVFILGLDNIMMINLP